MTERPPWQLGQHGGARMGAGGKPIGFVKSADQLDYENARARNEAARAALNTLKLQILRHEMRPRAMVVEKSATAIAALAQALRSIGDRLENEGVPLATCQMIERVISDTLNDLADDLKLLCGDRE